jgi:hypothetical protein
VQVSSTPLTGQVVLQLGIPIRSDLRIRFVGSDADISHIRLCVDMLNALGIEVHFNDQTLKEFANLARESQRFPQPFQGWTKTAACFPGGALTRATLG